MLDIWKEDVVGFFKIVTLFVVVTNIGLDHIFFEVSFLDFFCYIYLVLDFFFILIPKFLVEFH